MTPLDPQLRPILLSGGGILALGLFYFLLRFRISRMGRARGVISTPAVDRRNRQALEAMGSGKGEPAEGKAPEGLIKAVEEHNATDHSA